MTFSARIYFLKTQALHPYGQLKNELINKQYLSLVILIELAFGQILIRVLEIIQIMSLHQFSLKKEIKLKQ